MIKQQDPEIVHEVNAFKSFRAHLTAYLLINGFFWLIWFANGGMSIYAWPVYPTVIWGVILLIHFISAYRAFKKNV